MFLTLISAVATDFTKKKLRFFFLEILGLKFKN